MVEFQKNKWKYSTIGLVAILAVGFSFPQAFADQIDSIFGMVRDVQAKVNDSTYGLAAIKNAVSNTDSGLPAVNEELDGIQATLKEISQPGTIYSTEAAIQNPSPGYSGSASMLVPEGKIFVVEAITGTIRVPTASAPHVELVGYYGTNNIVPVYVGSQSSIEVDHFTFHQYTRLYFESTKDITLDFWRTGSAGDSSIEITLTGYLVDDK